MWLCKQNCVIVWAKVCEGVSKTVWLCEQNCVIVWAKLCDGGNKTVWWCEQNCVIAWTKMCDCVRKNEGVSSKWLYWMHYKLYNIVIVLCWQAWRDREKNCCYCEQMLPWCWTDEAASWISQKLGLLVFHIACQCLAVALCCWAVLTGSRWNLLPHTVTPLDVTTVAWYCRVTQDILHFAESPPAVLQTSQWQWTASVFTLI